MQFLSRPPCSTDPNSRTNLCPVKSAVAANVSSRVISPLLRRPHVATNVSSWPILPFSSPPPLHHSNSPSPHHSHTPFPTPVPSPAWLCVLCVLLRQILPLPHPLFASFASLIPPPKSKIQNSNPLFTIHCPTPNRRQIKLLPCHSSIRSARLLDFVPATLPFRP